MTTFIMKFGGTSVGSAEAIQQAAKIVKTNIDQGNRLVVVVSAMRGVTGVLIHCAKAAASGDAAAYNQLIDELRDRHHQTLDGLLLKEHERAPLVTIIDQHIDELSVFAAASTLWARLRRVAWMRSHRWVNA